MMGIMKGIPADPEEFLLSRGWQLIPLRDRPSPAQMWLRPGSSLVTTKERAWSGASWQDLVIQPDTPLTSEQALREQLKKEPTQ